MFAVEYEQHFSWELKKFKSVYHLQIQTKQCNYLIHHLTAHSIYLVTPWRSSDLDHYL